VRKKRCVGEKREGASPENPFRKKPAETGNAENPGRVEEQTGTESIRKQGQRNFHSQSNKDKTVKVQLHGEGFSKKAKDYQGLY